MDVPETVDSSHDPGYSMMEESERAIAERTVPRARRAVWSVRYAPTGLFQIGDVLLEAESARRIKRAVCASHYAAQCRSPLPDDRRSSPPS